jgi:hypothetical protein
MRILPPLPQLGADQMYAGNSSGTPTVISLGDNNLLGNIGSGIVGLEYLHVRKTSQTDRSSTTTLTADPELTLSPSINKNYFFNYFILYDTSATPDFKCGFNTPTGATWTIGGSASASTNSNVHRSNWMMEETTNPFYGWNAGAAVEMIMGYGFLEMGGTVDTFDFEWAQNTSDAATTSVLVDSWMALMERA